MNGSTIQLIEEYEINPDTMIIIPVSYGRKTYSQIWELEDEWISPFKPFEIIKKGCRFFGSSYEGRKEGTKQLTGITHKTPITIDPTNSIYFFPTSAASKPDCIWIAQDHVLSHKRAKGGNTEVVFKNKRNLTIPISNHSFKNQLLRTSYLKTSLTSRIEKSGRKSHRNEELKSKSLYFFDGKKIMNASEKKGKYHLNED